MRRTTMLRDAMDKAMLARIKDYPLDSEDSEALRYRMHVEDCDSQEGWFADAVSESLFRNFDRLYSLFLEDPSIFGVVFSKLIHETLDRVANRHA